MVARAVGDLANRGLTLADGVRNLVVLHLEDFAEEEHRAFHGAEGFEHGADRDRDASASSTSWAASGAVISGSGSHWPT